MKAAHEVVFFFTGVEWSLVYSDPIVFDYETQTIFPTTFHPPDRINNNSAYLFRDVFVTSFLFQITERRNFNAGTPGTMDQQLCNISRGRIIHMFGANSAINLHHDWAL